tara:strand:- start:7152 stop:7865 length:714 start_codon:yes stop_codon:yes gene_type:complete
MIFVDTVYQRVLALANKEQRGYITPQEFNLFACQAQLEIIEQYFYDVNRFSRFHGNDTEYSDMLNLLNEKISEISTSADLTFSGDEVTLPGDLYKLGTVMYGDTEADMVNRNELAKLQKSFLTQPKIIENSISTPVYVKVGNVMKLYPLPSTSAYALSLTPSITYVSKPMCPYWGYVVVDEKAMYNPSASVDFVIHSSDESEMVNRILAMAGVTIQKPELVTAATQFEQLKQTSEKQ